MSASSAEQMRAHRLAFELAMELRCTPKEAAKILRDRNSTRRRACGTLAPEPATETDFEPLCSPEPTFEDFGCKWMFRD